MRQQRTSHLDVPLLIRCILGAITLGGCIACASVVDRPSSLASPRVGTVAPAGIPTTGPAPSASLAPASMPPGQRALSPETAAQHAIAYAQHRGPGAYLVGDPDEIRGRLMSSAEFHRLTEGGPSSPVAPSPGQPIPQVWAIALRGPIVSASSVPPTLLPKSAPTYRQIIIALDADTGALKEIHAYPTNRELATTDWPRLPRPAGSTLPLPPSPTPGPPATPAPTKPVAVP
jgi:hypothetical protein